jgi:sugar-specific transcriptional regulator TrmB
MDRKKLQGLIIDTLSLTDKEATIYLELLLNGQSNPVKLARETKIKRPTVYLVLENLESKGFVSKQKSKNANLYQAIDANLVLERLRNKFQQFSSLLPLLESLKSISKEDDQASLFRYFTGENGLISIYEDTLIPDSEILAWANSRFTEENCLSNYYKIYARKKVKRNVKSKVILNYTPESRMIQKEGIKYLREVVLVPRQQFPLNLEINLYDDKVAIMAHEDLVGVIIQNASISEMLKSIFLMNFEYAKILEEKHFPSNN